MRHLAESILADWSLVADIGQQNLPQAAAIGRQNEEVRIRAGIAVPVALFGVAMLDRMPDRRGIAALAICICVALALLVEARKTSQSTRRTFLYLIAARQGHLPGLIVAATRIDPGVVRRLPMPGPFGS